MAAFHLSLTEFKQSTPSKDEEPHFFKNQEAFDPDYAKSLLYSLQSNLHDLKQEAYNLKNTTFHETGNSINQTHRTTSKILDYRKTPVQKKSMKAQTVNENNSKH